MGSLERMSKIISSGRSDIVDGPLVFIRFDIFFLCGLMCVTNIKRLEEKVKGWVREVQEISTKRRI